MWHWPSERGSGTGVLLVFLGEEGTEKGAPPWNFVCIFLKSDRSVNLTTMMMLMTRNNESDAM